MLFVSLFFTWLRWWLIVILASALMLVPYVVLSFHKKAYIAIYQNGRLYRNFFPVEMDDQERPYFKLDDLVSSLLETQMQCRGHQSYCAIRITPLRDVYWIDIGKHQVGNQKNVQQKKTIAPQDIIIAHQKIWLRYDEIARWLPLHLKWDRRQYAAYSSPDFVLPSDAGKERRREWREQL